MVLLFVLSLSPRLAVSASNIQEVATSAISAAEQSVAQAYEAVLDAERIGGNVSGLIVRLNDAADLLSEARMAFDARDFDEAIRFAGLSSEVGREVGDAAARVRVEANQALANRSWWFTGGSILGVLVVLSACLLGYPHFKRWYYRRLLKMKPRVGQA